MAKELQHDEFKMGVLLNLVMVNAHTMAALRHGLEEHLSVDEARSIAGEAFGDVTNNFLYFADDRPALAKAYEQTSEKIIKVVAEALLAG